MTNEDKKAAKYTHSVWTGKKYSKRQTQADLIAESMAMLRKHPTIGKNLPSSFVTEAERVNLFDAVMVAREIGRA